MGQGAQVLLVGLLAAGTLALGGCRAPPPKHDAPAYFLWAGVTPPARLASASAVYVLAGEVRAGPPARFVPLRAAPPRVRGTKVWLVVRVETLAWDAATRSRIDRLLAAWNSRTELAGLQIDFDAATRGLAGYAGFLRDLRARLPQRYRLSVTGLLDWSAQGDPAALAALGGTVDEVVIQTYQGRRTIPGYERYVTGLQRLPMPYRIGVVEDGGWHEPAGLVRDPRFRGYVIFLTEGAR